MPLYRRKSTSNPWEIKSGDYCLSIQGNEIISCFLASCYPSGNNRLSYYACSVLTQGVNFESQPEDRKPTISYLDIPLRHSYENQAWSIKSDIIAVGLNNDGTKNEYYSSCMNIVVQADSSHNYNMVGPIYSLNARTKPQMCVCACLINKSGVRFCFIDSDYTKMNWTSKIELIQTVYDKKITLDTLQEILDYISQNGLINSNLSDAEMVNDNALILDSEEDIYNSIFLDGGLDNGVN